jgi:hypothetical protein
LKTKKEKAVFLFHILVAVFIVIPYLTAVDVSDITPRPDYWLTLLMLLAFTSGLIGTVVWLVDIFIILWFDTTTKTMLDTDNVDLAGKAYVVVAVSTGFTMLLYWIGLVDDFFSFVSFY